MRATLFIAALLVSCVFADTYMHNMRGSNNRLNENNQNRNNANRLFDSQNNNQGGYNVGDNSDQDGNGGDGQGVMQYYATSILSLEWTAQHGMANPNMHVNYVIQAMCDDAATGFNNAGLRDGATTTAPNANNDADPNTGRHEIGTYYNDCAARERNKGLFTADQDLNGNTAIFTRQNTNGQQSGLECPEERDYYPYWHPTPWVDIAVLTEDLSLCDMYTAQSQNVVNKGHCTGTKPATGNNNDITDGVYYNNPTDCNAAGGGIHWVEDSAFNREAPACLPAPWSRDNHLGNGLNGYANTFDWKIPVIEGQEDVSFSCVLRVRYNMSTADYDGWNTDSSVNGANKSPVTQNPTIDLTTGQKTTADGNGFKLKLALNTDQYGRTFQDRSSVFIVKPRPSDVPKSATIYNLNVKGQRGNIVENYPAVEYDFTPNNLVMATGDYVHRQVSGSNTTPAGAGQGRESTDRSNIVETVAQDVNRPRPLHTVTMIADPQGEGYAMVKQWATLGQNDNEQDDAAPYQDFGIMKYEEPMTITYISTRTNNFSNRSQKGVITVINADGLSTGAIVGIVIGSTAGVAIPTGAAVYGHKNPNSAVGRGMSKIKGIFNRSPSIPSNYAMSS